MKKIKKIIFHTLILLTILLIIIQFYIYENFGNLDLRQLFYHIEFPIIKNSGNFLSSGFNFVMPKFLLISTFYCILILIFNRININLSFHFKTTKKININKHIYKYRFLFLIISIIVNVLLSDKYFNILISVKNQFITTEIYENYYVDSMLTTINFPDKKRNLIYIFVESLESSDFSELNGGYREKSIIPELEKLAKRNINFSDTNKLGGFYQASGTGFTIGAIAGQTAGLPLISANTKDENSRNLSEILKNVYSIGEILESVGYKNYFMMGSDKKFANRDGYLMTHGNYEVFDFYSAIDRGYIPSDYNISWWGFEDNKLYEYAKLELKRITKNKEPFNFSILTVDTHPNEGYLDETCQRDSEFNNYENVYKCASSMLHEFINWIQKQPFYKNTTVVIVGDHLNMVINNIHKNIPDDYDRTVFNVFMNSAVTTKCTKNRIFTAFDMFPTTLSALGAKIDGEKLGFGTNLFSCEETLPEQIGMENLNNELNKNSSYYKLCLLYGICGTK